MLKRLYHTERVAPRLTSSSDLFTYGLRSYSHQVKPVAFFASYLEKIRANNNRRFLTVDQIYCADDLIQRYDQTMRLCNGIKQLETAGTITHNSAKLATFTVVDMDFLESSDTDVKNYFKDKQIENDKLFKLIVVEDLPTIEMLYKELAWQIQFMVRE